MSHEKQRTHRNNVKCPAKRLLVISENQELSLFLKNELEENLFKHSLKVDFCYTSFNLNPQQMIEIGAEKINVKDESTVSRIIENYDLVFSLHCKQIFPKRLIENVCCVNFHPGLNPYNRGWYPQAFSIINGLPVGSTIHLMDAEVDHGEIIAQKEVGVKISDTSLDIYRKIIAAEKELMRENVFNIIEGIFNFTKPEQDGNYNGIKEYNALCELNLTSVATFGEHLNVLRATTHGDFKNAYFVDENGKKYFVRVIIEEDV
ncbi:dTDP-4-amino-4,6-dideoxyglucose formyltransferase [Pectobacterium peruviense]|uniref:Methionyl-tRNA formyltransferase n=1 Tax=Pectobacterium peruviense TaxID=2066479 RepID=A0ABX4S2N9_9GAMM|nr:dTDP-4-amino-4,6-dideoxyglucose formyltransferase [Pectobacterium peruviense]KML67851.1 methionyl-tRNA formyltransferase [Pectobacterium peruviense]PKX81437.1 methionyl-tRNA formyltransferase [Pectobacterium peruviense]PKX84311.1 methionyl-tRNA formyltransferase [Pectobacterium peruviense]